MSIEDARKAIDRLDEAIVKLLDERARVGTEIGRLKKGLGLPLHNPGREHEVLRRLRGLSDGSMPASGIDAIYRAIMAETLALQKGESRECRGHDAAGKRDVAAEVAENVEIAPGFRRMRLRVPDIGAAFAPGQFFQLRIGSGGEFFLRRPFAPCECDGAGLAFFYAVVGKGTAAMARLRSGARVGLLAPLGNSYRLPAPGSRALLLGGGCGAPSLAPLARALKEARVHVTAIVGARTEAVLLEREAFARVTDRLILTTDDGSNGCRGTALDAYHVERESMGRVDGVFACGPTSMLRAVAGMAKAAGLPCQVSLEERMACGFGACMGCAVPVRGEGGSVYRRVCHEGPVFDADALAWDEMR